MDNEERKRKIELRQFAFAEIKNKKNPDEIVQELVEKGMEEQEASELVNELRKVALSKSEFETERQSWRGFVIAGAIMTVIGTSITVFSYILATTEGGKFVFTFGLIAAGLALLGTGLSRRPRKDKEN